MVRKVKIQLFFNRCVLLQVFRKFKVQSNNQYFYVFNKSTTIVGNFLGQNINIYKGNLFRKIFVSKYLIGYKFGEFTHTRKPFNYPIVKKKKKNLRR